MPLGIGSGFWAIVRPVEKTNQALNPSYEFGTTGVAAIQGATIGSTSQYQQFGAWSCSITPGSNGTSGGALGTWTATNGADYTVSVYARLVNGIGYRFAVADSSGVNFVSGGTTTVTGGGTWARYSVSYTEPTGAARRLVVTKSGANDTNPFYVDGLQIEQGSLTTYIDGDQPGGTWQGAPHASTTFRSGQYRGGGSVVALADLGWNVDQMPGVGAPPMENSFQPYAVVDGAQYQRTRVAQRSFTLTAKPIVGTTTADYHITRRSIWDVFKVDEVSPQQLTRLLYVGGQGTQYIDALYDHGFELGQMDGPMAENIGVSFLATDPYFYAPTQQGTTLAPRVSLGSTNFILKRSPLGVWGTLGANGTTVQYNLLGCSVYSLTVNPAGTLFFGGAFGTVAGTVFPTVGMYYPSTNTFGTLAGGGTVDTGGIFWNGLQFNTTGTLFLSGGFTRAGGTANLRSICQWTGAGFGTLSGGTPNNAVVSIFYSPNGTLFCTGNFTDVNGTANAGRIAQWNGAWGTLGFGGLSQGAIAMTWGLNNSLYFGGGFTSVGGTGGTAVGFWNGSFGTLQSGGCDGLVRALAVGANGVLYEGGFFSVLGGQSLKGVAQFNGIRQSSLGSGFNNAGTTADIWAIAPDPIKPNTYLIGGGNIINSGYVLFGNNGILTPNNIAQWNGNSLLPLDIVIPAGTVYAIASAPDKTLYLGGQFSGTAIAATTGTVINAGRAAAYPTVRWRNTGASGTARVLSLINNTTGAALYLGLSLLPGDIATLTLQPGNRSFQSLFQGNVFNSILPGSNLTNWNLLSGTNYVSFLSDSDNLETAIFWQPKGWSADSGTVY